MKRIATSARTAAMILVPATRVADAKDLPGGIAGGVVVNEANGNRTPAPTPRVSPTTSATRAATAACQVQPGEPATNGLTPCGAVTAALLASQGSAVSPLTSTRGGFGSSATMSAPMVAPNERFFRARTYVVARGRGGRRSASAVVRARSRSGKKGASHRRGESLYRPAPSQNVRLWRNW